MIGVLPGRVTLALDRQTGRLEGTIESELPGPGALASYLAALDVPYQGNDIDRLWDYPARPEGTRFAWREITVDGKATEVQPNAVLVLVSGKRVRARFSA